MISALRLCVLLAGLPVLSACTVGPDYQRPPAAAPSAYKELWKPSQPGDALPRGAWWSVYGDPVLDGLEGQAETANQTVIAAEASYRQAAALVQAARAGLFPTLGLDGGAQRGERTGKVVANQFTTSLTAGWETDLWGRVRRGIESEEAGAQASAADLASARLAEQGAVATDYLLLRSADEQQRLLEATVAAYARSLEIVRNQYAAGIASKADLAQAQTQLESARSQALNTGIARAQLEHALAVLTGQPPSGLAIAPSEAAIALPDVPVDLPSTLLERRPDIAGAERRMAAANAQIGVAMAAFYPDLTLSASGGFAGSAIDTLLTASNRLWSVGPELAVTLFDGGARSAQLASSRAVYDQETALYRQTVLTGFQQVEDQLAALRILAQQAVVQDRAVKAAEDAEHLLFNQYRAGIVAYTSVVTAQTATLSNRQTALTIRQNRLSASVALIEALGGGWTTSDLIVFTNPSP